MNTKLRFSYVVFGVVMTMATGCATKGVVKTEEPVAVQTVKANVEPVKPIALPTKVVAAESPKSEHQKSVVTPAVKASPQTVSFDSIYFEFDKTDLTPPDRNMLSANADKMLKGNSRIKVRIEGNCDERGSAEYNLALGERRAKAAQQYLTTLGVPAERLSIISYGKERPAVAGHDEAAWVKNRRDDFIIQ